MQQTHHIWRSVQQKTLLTMYCFARTSSVVTISRPPTSSLKITNRIIQHATPRLWNKLPHSLGEPHPHPGFSPLPPYTSWIHAVITTIFTFNHSFSFTLDLKHTTSSSFFHHRLLHRYSLDWSHGLTAGPFSLAHRVCFSFTSRLSAVS